MARLEVIEPTTVKVIPGYGKTHHFQGVWKLDTEPVKGGGRLERCDHRHRSSESALACARRGGRRK